MIKIPVEIFAENGVTKIRTLQPIGFTGNDGQWHTIPAGYVSDGASVPRFFWRILSPNIDGRTLLPSIIHDFEYENGIGTRKAADFDYGARLYENHYGIIRSGLTWIGVRIGGTRHWRAAA